MKLELYYPHRPLYVGDFIEFTAEFLGIDKYKKELVINFKKSLPDDSYGHCWGDRKYAEIEIALEQSTGRITRKEKLETIAHEMVHARQYFRGDLKQIYGKEGDIYGMWKGEKYLWHDNSFKNPWEKEAHKLEKVIYEAYRA